MQSSEIPGLHEFLRDYPLMALRPSIGSKLLLKGRFAFSAHAAKHGEIKDVFALAIEVPHEFPKDLPKVTETDGRIPRLKEFHVNPNGTLCLGSPLSLLVKISKAPTLVGFADKCLVPYLFAISHKLTSGGPLPFGELDHGVTGMLPDYARLFGLTNSEQVRVALKLLGMKKRRANKLRCPCGCGLRVGKCSFNHRLREFRALASRAWFRAHAALALK